MKPLKEYRITMYLKTATKWVNIANYIEEAIIAQGYLVDFSDNEFIEVEKVEESN